MPSLLPLVLFHLSLATFVLASSHSSSDNPICQRDEGNIENDSSNEANFEIKASVLLNDTLFLVVLGDNRTKHIVYEVSSSEISLTDHRIYLQFSKPMSMQAKWGFEPAERGITIGTVFGIHSLQLPKHTQPDHSIVFVNENGDGAHLLRLSTNQLESAFEWNQTGSMVLGIDNEGYFFGRDNYWYAQECAFQPHIRQFAFSPHKYFVLLNPVHKFLLFKKIGPRTDEQFLDWAHFSGFIYYNQVYLFSNHSVYLFEDSQEFAKVGFEYPFAYRKYSYQQFFQCQREHLPQPFEAEQDDPSIFPSKGDYIEHSQSSLLNVILFGLFAVVAISFYIRSQILKSKSAKYKAQTYYKNKY